MTEAYLAFSRKYHGNQPNADASYLALWTVAQKHELPTGVVKQGNLPLIPGREERALITEGSLEQIFTLPRADFRGLMRDYRRVAKEQGADKTLSNENLLAMYSDYIVSQNTPDKFSDLADNRGRLIRHALGFIVVGLTAKALDQMPTTPDLIKGHIADFLAVPVYVAVTRGLLSVLPKPLRGNSQKLFNKQMAFGLLGMYGIEVAQAAGFGGTFDMADLLAYTLGAVVHYPLLKPRIPTKSRNAQPKK